MAIVKDHYENHLAKYYSWMSGGFVKKIDETIAELTGEMKVFIKRSNRQLPRFLF